MTSCIRPSITGSGSNTEPPPSKSASATDKRPTQPDAPTVTPTSVVSSEVSSTPSARSQSSVVSPTLTLPPSKPTDPVSAPSSPGHTVSPSKATPPVSAPVSNSPTPPTQPQPPQTNDQKTGPQVVSSPSSDPSSPQTEPGKSVGPVVSSDVAKPVKTPSEVSGPPQAPETIASVAPVLTSEPAPERTESVAVGISKSGHGAVPTPSFTPSLASSTPAITRISPADNLQANAQSSASVSTVTDRPETTLTSPVFISTTDSAGHLSLSVPPVFTSLGVSTEANGQLVSVTHVIANPTGIWGVGDTSAVTKHG